MKSMTVFSGVRMKWLAFFAGVCCLSIATGAPAAQGEKPCADDAARLCKDVQPGKGGVAKCLKAHKDELSPACMENMGRMKKKAGNMKQACKEDADKLCKGMEHGGGKVRDCLKEHEGELSTSCKEMMDRPGGRR
ncbi:MAG: hypothetical protein HY938_02055 [Nitrosomonadales bacterium]|nr:hypothetical protein [Nitrosomonadales bacterium]